MLKSVTNPGWRVPARPALAASGKYYNRPSLMAPIMRIAPLCTCARLAERKVPLISPRPPILHRSNTS